MKTISSSHSAYYISALAAWREKGAEVVKGDLNDKESLVTAFTVADVIFSTPDFWAPFHSPATQKLLKEGQTINENCYEKELQQGKNVTDAAASTEGLDRFIISALYNAKERSSGKYTWVYHFDSKAKIIEYIQTQHLNLADEMSVFQVASYMANWKYNLKIAKVCQYSASTPAWMALKCFAASRWNVSFGYGRVRVEANATYQYRERLAMLYELLSKPLLARAS